MESSRSILALTLALWLATVGWARADQSYTVSGNDTYRVGSNANVTNIDYQGTQRLAVSKSGSDRHFVAVAEYTRTDQTGSIHLHARFVQYMAADGTLDDRSDQDPDFLTILNQPFAVQLDARTIRDLRLLRGAVPFEATSPLGGAHLTGMLRPALAGTIHGRSVIGVRFAASGVMTGRLPQRSDAQLEGTIRMNGTAYYAEHAALLLALNATLTIEGTLRDKGADIPVRIIYHRVIRASDNPPQ